MCLFLLETDVAKTTIINVSFNRPDGFSDEDSIPKLKTEQQIEDYKKQKKSETRFFLYSNEAKTITGDKNTSNAMLIALPDVQSVSNLRFLNYNEISMTSVKYIENKFEKFVNLPIKTRSAGPISKGVFSSKVGMYDVFYSRSLDELERLVKIDISKNTKGFYKNYPDETVYFAFKWEGTQAIDAQPIIIVYDSLSCLPFFPMLDDHTGKGTKNERVLYNHLLICEAQANMPSEYTANIQILGQPLTVMCYNYLNGYTMQALLNSDKYVKDTPGKKSLPELQNYTV